MAVDVFTILIHKEVEKATRSVKKNPKSHNYNFPSDINNLIRIKRDLRKTWQQTHYPQDKAKFNKAAKELKSKLYDYKNECVGNYLKDLDATKTTDFSLWKATKYIKRPVQRKIPIQDESKKWHRSDQAKAEAFTSYLSKVFQPIVLNPNSSTINAFLDAPCQMDFPIRPFLLSEVQDEIARLNNRKSPGFDGLDARTIKILPKKCQIFLTTLYNSILRVQHFPTQWKCAEIIMIAKPNKLESQVSSYRPISLLVTLSKIFEKIFLRRLSPILKNLHIIPEHQFGFRAKHSTIEQCHRIVNYITNSLERKKYCSGVFLDIQQAFDKVWHIGLLYKIKKWLPSPFYLLMKSYLSDRHFYVRSGNEKSRMCEIGSGIPQGSVLGPVLYTIFTSDLRLPTNIFVATYADDTAILASDPSVDIACSFVQKGLQAIEQWLKNWNMAVNTKKSVHVTFTLNRGSSPKLKINNEEIPQSDVVKYLGLHLDKRLTWKYHIQAIRKQLNAKTKKMYWLLGPNSELSLNNKLLLYKCVLKPVWTYGAQLWGACSLSNIKILERYQSKTLRLIVNAPWFIRNKNICADLQVPSVLKVVNKYSENYLGRISNHPNTLAICLLDDTEEIHRLKRFHILDLPFRK